MPRTSRVDDRVDERPDEAADDGRLIVIYERVSSAAQDISRQAARRDRVHAANPGREIVVIQDDGISAFKVPIFDRPGGMRLCRLLEDGRIDELHTDAQDRLSRGRQSEWWSFVDLLAEGGTRLIIDGRELRFDEDADEIKSAIDQLVARRESREKSHRMRTKLPITIRERGYKPGGKRPFGRERDGTVREREARVVRELIVPAILGGRSETWIARDLNAAGIHAAQGGRWRPSTLAGLLRRPDLCGLVLLEGEPVRGTREPIVDVETWERVQAVFAARRSGPERRGRDPALEYMIDSPIKLTCGLCGEPMWKKTGNKRVDGSRQGSYVCSGPDDCPARPVPREKLDEAVLAVFERTILDTQGTLCELERASRDLTADTRRALNAADAEVDRYERQLAYVRREFREERITANELHGHTDEIEADLASARAEAAQLRARSKQIAGKAALEAAQRALAAKVDEIRRLAESTRVSDGRDTIAAVRAALAQVVEEIVVADMNLLAERGEGYLGVRQAARLGIKPGHAVTVAVATHATDHGAVGFELVPRSDLGQPARDLGGFVVPLGPGRAPLPASTDLLTLHLDESQLAAAAGDQVELVAAGPDVRAEDPPAAEPVPPQRAALGAAPATRRSLRRSRAPGS